MTKVTVRPILLTILALVLAAPGVADGQENEMIIEPWEEGDPFLNEIIAGDTTETGERVNPDRVYVLRRDGVYFINDDIRANEFTLRITTEEGDGARAIIYPITNTTTTTFPDPIIDMAGDVWVKDVVLTGYYDSIPEEVANIASTIVRSTSPGYTLTMDGVIMSNTRGQHVRTEAAAENIRITNSVFANMGDLGRSNFGAGKGIDLRDGSIDTLFLQNNTFVNFQDRIIRHRSSTAAIDHLVFDHNTVINGMSYHGTLALGWMGSEAQITNNLFLDPVVAGEDSSDTIRNEEFDEHGEVFPNGEPTMPWIFTVPNDTTQWTVANNFYAISDDVEDFYETYGDGAGDDGNPDNGADGDNDIMGPGSPLSDHILGRIDNAEEAFTEVDLDVANRPDVMLNMAEWYRTETGRTKDTDTFIRQDDDFDRRPVTYFMTDFDASYATDSPAYTGAEDEYPAGDLNWFPDQKAMWEEDQGTDVERISEVPSAYRLEQNYPNPFNPVTTIQYGLPHTASVSLVIYNVLGQEITRLVDNQQQIAGAYRVTWDGTDLTGQTVATGMYFYQLKADDAVVTKRMMLIK